MARKIFLAYQIDVIARTRAWVKMRCLKTGIDVGHTWENRYKWLQEEIPAKHGQGVGAVLRSIWFKTGKYFREHF